MYRRHVRESLARMMEYTSVLFNKIKAISENTAKRQSDVEKRQTNVEEQFKDVLANTTVDSEVINARDSDKFGKFKVLDERIEYLENIIASVIPVGFDVIISHDLGAQPEVNVRTWTYGIGVLPLGTETEGLFGGTASKSVQCSVKHVNASECVVTIPLDFKTDAIPVKITDYKYLIIDEKTYRSIVFDIIL
ncbi:hypothetical protein [Melissococcus plutonius]